MLNSLVVFGASGDLTGRLLLPAVAALQAAGALSSEFRLIGAGQQAWSADDFAGHARRRLAEHAPSVVTADRDAVVAALRYRQADVAEPSDVADVLDFARAESEPGPLAVYLALPTQLMLGSVRALRAHGLPPGSRVAVEKPFGVDAGSAAELNVVLADLSADRQAIYRVDHALAMTAVPRLLRACWPGTEQEIEWSGRQILQIDLLWEETLALEGRASFYDRAGALRDVMENHLVQLLCTIAQPRAHNGTGIDPIDASERRASVLRTVRPLSATDVRTRTRRARYVAGSLADSGRMVPDYSAEAGVDAARNTETFAEVILELDTPQWTDTQFVLRAGKALDARRRGVQVHPRPNRDTGALTDAPVWLDVDEPDDARAGGAEPGAYQRLIADFLSGGTAFAVGAAEAELAWQVFTPVLRGWAQDAVPLLTYSAGSTGP